MATVRANRKTNYNKVFETFLANCDQGNLNGCAILRGVRQREAVAFQAEACLGDRPETDFVRGTVYARNEQGGQFPLPDALHPFGATRIPNPLERQRQAIGESDRIIHAHDNGFAK